MKASEKIAESNAEISRLKTHIEDNKTMIKQLQNENRTNNSKISKLENELIVLENQAEYEDLLTFMQNNGLATKDIKKAFEKGVFKSISNEKSDINITNSEEKL